MCRVSAVYLLFTVILSCLISPEVRSAEGDQFLDGIGETALIARYLFNGNLEDRSRNSFHAVLYGQGGVFVDDEQFGKVLSLPGGPQGAYVQIPGQALVDIENQCDRLDSGQRNGALAAVF